MKKKAAVFGAFGQLGVELCAELKRRGYEVEAFERARLDITNADHVEKAVGSFDPSVVFNAAAYNQVDVAEREPMAAMEANGLAVRNLALACRQNDARLVHFSTDYVFDGALRRPYRETDAVRPLGAYAVSKLAGELYAQAYCDDALVVRTSGVFGPGALHTARGNFPELMLRLAREGKPIRVVEDHVASPTYAPWLAARSIDLCERNASGIFHIGGGDPISWFEYAKLIFGIFGVTADLKPTNEREYRTAARRPKFSALENARMAELGVAPMPPLVEAVKEYRAAREKALAAHASGQR
ncbi:MAG TPA: dTDP-4-dehydrorhamnose reductase [Bryobacteraceae bacterium]|nr:dTDP-4-dehydrorhamnose reductase [Bryobacteraceae bacterium]